MASDINCFICEESLCTGETVSVKDKRLTTLKTASDRRGDKKRKIERIAFAIAKKDDAELLQYLEYELAPFSLALFNEAGMRKTKKSALYDIFKESRKNVNHVDCTHVIDGGYLLHRVVWHQNQTYDSICTAYVDYINNNFGARSVIVFNSYTDSSSRTKKN